MHDARAGPRRAMPPRLRSPHSRFAIALSLTLAGCAGGIDNGADETTESLTKCSDHGQVVYGVDVSGYQGSSINRGSVKAAGRVFAFAKATEGTGFIDGSFAHNERLRVLIAKNPVLRYDRAVPESQLKGSAYLSTLAFIDTRFGSAAKERVLARLTPEDRAVLGQLMLPIQWYPLAPFPRLLRAMDAEVGRGDLSLVTERGTWAAVQDMRTVHRVLLKLVTPQWVIDKGMKLWPNFHTSGRWEAKRLGDRGARASLHDLGVVDEAMCATLKGWILGLLQLAGIKRATVEHVDCRARGDQTCVFLVGWT